MTRIRRFQLACGHVRRFGDGFAPGLVVRCSTCRDDRAIAVRLPDRPGLVPTDAEHAGIRAASETIDKWGAT